AFDLGGGQDVCLLLHGLTGSPAEVRPVGEALARAGMRSVGPLLPGHGTRPEDLFGKTHLDLLRAAESALRGLAGARRIYLCGLSAGALLAIHLAARAPDIRAVALLAPAVAFSHATWLFAEVLGRLPVAPRVLLAKGARDVAVADDRESVAQAYTAVPLSWGRELRLLAASAREVAPEVRAPALILSGGRDRTVSPAGAQKLALRLGSPKPVRTRVFPASGHLLPLDRDSAEVCDEVVRFFVGGK
ncbi:MAG TPA: alpha/beta fold hydrolase, partial [Myxococcales bacterium]